GLVDERVLVRILELLGPDYIQLVVGSEHDVRGPSVRQRRVRRRDIRRRRIDGHVHDGGKRPCLVRHSARPRRERDHDSRYRQSWARRWLSNNWQRRHPDGLWLTRDRIQRHGDGRQLWSDHRDEWELDRTR